MSTSSRADTPHPTRTLFLTPEGSLNRLTGERIDAALKDYAEAFLAMHRARAAIDKGDQ